MLAEFRDRGVEGPRRLPLQGTDLGRRHRYAEEVRAQLFNLALAEAVGPGEQSQHRLQPWPVLSPGRAVGQLGAGRGAAGRASEPVQPILGDRWPDGGQFHYLVADRLRVVALPRAAAPATRSA